MINQLLILPFDDLKLLDSNFSSIWKYREVKKSDSLVILKELDLTKDHAEHPGSRPDRRFMEVFVDAAAAGAITILRRIALDLERAVVATHRPLDWAEREAEQEQLDRRDRANNAYWKIHAQAKEEFKETGKIKGYEILNLRLLEKLWISNYDIHEIKFKK